MKKLALTALLFTAACGIRGSSTTYVGPSTYQGGGVLAETDGDYPNTPDYLIDAGAGVQPPLGTYAITTNGQGDWILGWQGDQVQHHFTGDVYCPVGCTLTALFDMALPGDSVNTIANNHVGFDAVTDASVRQSLSIATTSTGGPEVPMTWVLFIDGHPAVNPYVVFSSAGRLATSDISPFNLVPSTYVQAKDAELAPMFKMPKDKEGKTFNLPAPPPRAGGSRTETESKTQVVEASAQQ